MGGGGEGIRGQRSTSFHHELGDTIFKSSAVGARRRLAVAPGSVVGAVLDTDVLEPARRNVVALLIDVVVAARVFVRPPELPVVAFRNAFVVDGVLLLVGGVGPIEVLVLLVRVLIGVAPYR